jgi:glycosyltransferase involved in cell wall biosynthesis
MENLNGLSPNHSTIAILIPCYNESATLPLVIQHFKRQLPDATLYVYDNDSTDDTARIAASQGAIVKYVKIRGKGQVVRRMFADIEADVYVMVDGDATYDASSVNKAVNLLQQQALDMVVCTRKPVNENSFRPGHAFGNKLFTRTVNFLFGNQFRDIFSGYRIFSRRFVKSFPAISHGFEIEAEITIHALQLGIPTGEIETPYQERPPGSTSKLNTFKDGLRILRTVMLLFLYIRPMALFSSVFLVLTALAILLGVPVIIHFIHTGLVPRMPTALLAAALGLLACLSLTCGIILDSISRSRLETKRCWYLIAASTRL